MIKLNPIKKKNIMKIILKYLICSIYEYKTEAL